MRKILFRGKAINRDKGFHRTNYKNGDFVYGLVTQLYDERFENLPAEMTDTSGVSGIEVDYKTIGQFTGLTDKNEKKVFDGDILKFTDTNAEYEWIGKVEFGNPNAEYNWGFQLVYISGTKPNTDILLWFDMEETGAYSEVIGNIHDNPELLENP